MFIFIYHLPAEIPTMMCWMTLDGSEVCKQESASNTVTRSQWHSWTRNRLDWTMWHQEWWREWERGGETAFVVIFSALIWMCLMRSMNPVVVPGTLAHVCPKICLYTHIFFEHCVVHWQFTKYPLQPGMLQCLSSQSEDHRPLLRCLSNLCCTTLQSGDGDVLNLSFWLK